MSTPPITAWVPKVSPDPKPDEIHRHLTLVFQKLANHATAFGLQQAKINSIKAGVSTVIQEGGSGGGGSVIPFVAPAAIPVNDQSGNTAYATVSGDDGTMIVLSDAAPIAVTLTSQSPPWSCFLTNQSALGGGTATLTPSSGTINGAASLAFLPTYGAIVAFDGTNWFALTMPIVPVGNAGTAHEWIASYDATTGLFTLSQPAIADILGLAAALAALAPIASPTFTGTVTEPAPAVLTAATTATTATAGAASALPATPLGYLQMSVNGVTVKVPFYSV